MPLARPVHLGRPWPPWHASPASMALRSLPATPSAEIVSFVDEHRQQSMHLRQEPGGFANLVAARCLAADQPPPQASETPSPAKNGAPLRAARQNGVLLFGPGRTATLATGQTSPVCCCSATICNRRRCRLLRGGPECNKGSNDLGSRSHEHRSVHSPDGARPPATHSPFDPVREATVRSSLMHARGAAPRSNPRNVQRWRCSRRAE